MTKRCGRCKQEFPLNEFGRNIRSRDGLQGYCKECTRKYTAQWRENNPERAAEYQKQYIADGRGAAACARWDKTHADKRAAARKTPKWRAQQRERDRRYAERHPEKLIEKDRKRRSTDEFKLKDRVFQSNRRARKRELPGEYTPEDVARLLAASNKCHICKRPFTAKRKPTIDHVLPISSELGSNGPDNLVLACLSCNCKKKDSRFNPLTGQGILI